MKTPRAMPVPRSPPMRRRRACRAGSTSRRRRRAARSCRSPHRAARSGSSRAPVRPLPKRRWRGGVVAVPETEIAPALRALGQLGLFVEPTAATGAAALSLLLRDGTIQAGETTVVVLTGHGLKATDKIAELLGV